MTNKNALNIIFEIALIFVVVAIFEIFVFNFRHFESTTFDSSINDSIEFSKVETHELEDDKLFSSNTSDSVTYFKSNQFFNDVQNIHIDGHSLRAIGETEWSKPLDKVMISVYVRDEGHNLYDAYPRYSLDMAWKTNYYMKIEPYGKAKQIIVGIESNYLADPNDAILELNSVVPFVVSKTRLVFMLILIGTILLLRKSSFLLGFVNDNKLRVRFAYVTLVVVQVGVLLWVSNNGSFHKWTEFDSYSYSHQQYQLLTNSILNGHFYLDIAVPDFQKNADNPYDFYYLSTISTLPTWDIAYFGGKYYCYFGILPVLLMYLPFQLLTGCVLKEWMAVSVSFVLVSISMLFLLIQLKRRYFPYISFKNLIILDLLMFFGSCVPVFALDPYFYSMVIVLSVSFVSLALGFWIRASIIGKNSYYVVGSICMAFVCMARPAHLLGVLLVVPFAIIPLSKKYLTNNSNLITRKINKQRFLKVVLLNTVPFLIVGSIQMYYNYARFGNIFDFGASYNITTNDMTHRGFLLDRFPPGIFEYLLQPPILSPKFPYFTSIIFGDESVGFLGSTIMENCYGGYIWISPIVLVSISLVLRKSRKVLQYNTKYNEIKYAVILSLLSGFTLVLADTQIAGILFRYFQDFGLFFAIAGILPLGALLEGRMDKDMFSNIDNHANKPKVTVGCGGENVSALNIDAETSNRTNSLAFAILVYTLLMWAFIVMAMIF